MMRIQVLIHLTAVQSDVCRRLVQVVQDDGEGILHTEPAPVRRADTDIEGMLLGGVVIRGICHFQTVPRDGEEAVVIASLT